MIQTFDEDTFYMICDKLAEHDSDFASIVTTYGYPPLWSRPNSFESLVHIILEQQVSLASAKTALEKLRKKVVEITPERVAILSDEEFKAVYFSRQKTAYVKHLTQQILAKQLDLVTLEHLDDDVIRQKLVTLKGVGNWTVDVYLIMVLHRADVFPIGDIAAMNALKRLKRLPEEALADQLLEIAEAWRPYRSVATMLLWHYYLSSKKKK